MKTFDFIINLKIVNHEILFEKNYLKKSKTQKMEIWILLGTGTAIAAYSLITINNHTDSDVGDSALTLQEH